MPQYVLPTVEDMEAIRQLALKVKNTNGPGVRNAPEGITITPPKPGGRSSPAMSISVVRMAVFSIHDNYAECALWLPVTTNGTTTYQAVISETRPAILVALPPELQRQRWDGLTFTDPLDSNINVEFAYVGAQQRDATLAGVTQSQRIIPWYVEQTNPGTVTEDDPVSLIWATTSPVVVPGDGGTGEVQCAYIDANFGGRAWAMRA